MILLRFYGRWRPFLWLMVVGMGGELILQQAEGATESWADERLQVTRGLTCWLDVSRQNAARGTLSIPPLNHVADYADYAFDGSGNKRHFFQPQGSSRPKFYQDFNGAYFAFDGKDDALEALAPGLTLSQLTLIAVFRPRNNDGLFRALFSGNAPGRNDYTTGINIDLGSASTAEFSRLSVEGPGFSGESNLLKERFPFRQWKILTISCGTGDHGIRTWLDGVKQADRSRSPGNEVRLDEFRVGARHYSNDASRPYTQNFLQGDLAELLIYSSELTDAERTSVEDYLRAKYAGLRAGRLDGRRTTVEQPPPVQMLVPGFESVQLPVKLNNLNALGYLPSGGLVGAGYDGSVWHLTDTDGDGVEDRATLFWKNDSVKNLIGMTVTPPGYPRGEGVFVTTRNKVLLLLDKDGDHRADQELVVASGWKEPRFVSGGVIDALGITLDREGNVYFALGNNFFWEAYEINKETGKSEYQLDGERGTIQKVSSDFLHRETLCSGVRFGVGLAVNALGDLFATDQEGATWLPNGNPFDELLHIQSGRHYGFPPQHPRHLPSVIDEPSVFDYEPQHQSTCGLHFNSVPGKEVSFGPARWAGDALVSGYSRGKIWRTQLVRTDAGYVAANQLIAQLQALVIDACVSPRGDLVVATHSGLPDWGSGPNGQGTLWRVRLTDPKQPQPVLTWSSAPGEWKVAFDRPVNPASLAELTKKGFVTAGRYVQAGDRFETLRPGYQVVHDQMAQARETLEIRSVGISPDARTITLTTDPRKVDQPHALTLPLLLPKSERHPSSAPEIDLAANLHGIEAKWISANGQTQWNGWLPHPDLAVSRELTRGSAEHEALFQRLASPGSLRLQTRLNLYQMLQPAIQPGAALDYQRPVEKVTVTFNSSSELTVRTNGVLVGSGSSVLWTAEGEPDHGVVMEVEIPTGSKDLFTHATWTTDRDSRPRAFPLRRFRLPWSDSHPALPAAEEARKKVVPEIVGGDWLQGRQVFFASQASCSKCHTMHGQGGHIGPDLSNLIHRDYASVMKDIRLPNATLNPDHLATVVELKDGESITGLLTRETPDAVTVTEATGHSTLVSRSRIRSLKPSALSLMPEGLWDGLSEKDRRDLMTFLLTQPVEVIGSRPPVQGQSAPRLRRTSELEAVLKAGESDSVPASSWKPLRVVLCAAAKDGGHSLPGMHDYPQWRDRWSQLLQLGPQVTVDVADRWPSAQQFAQADVVVSYHDNPAWEENKSADLDRFLERGGGMVFLHWAVNGQRSVEALARRLGKAWKNGESRFRYGAQEVSFLPHPITRGFDKISWMEESYWNLTEAPGDVQVLGQVTEEGSARPQIWVKEQGRGRVMVCIPGHFSWTFDDPLYRILLLRGIAWTAHQPLNRLIDLATVGVALDPESH